MNRYYVKMLRFINNDIIKKSFYVLLTYAFGKSVLIIINALLVKYIGPKNFGDYSAAMSMIIILSALIIFGLDNGLIKYVPMLKVRYPKEFYFRGINLYSMIFVITSSVIVTFLAYAIIEHLQLFSLIPFINNNNFWVIIVVLFIYPVFKVFLAILQSNGRVIPFALFLNVIEPLLLLVVILCFTLVKYSTEKIAFLAKFLSMLIVVINITFFLVKHSLIRKKENIPRELKIEYVKFSFPLMLSTIIGILLIKVSILIISFFLTSIDVAIFNVAYDYSMLATFLLTAVNQVFAPMVSDLYERKKISELQNKYSMINMVMLFFSIFVMIGILLVGDKLLLFYGAEFLNGKKALIIIMVGQLFNAIAGPCMYMVTIIVNSKMNLIINVFTLVLNVTSSVLLIELYGINGVAISVSISLIVSNLLRVWVLYKTSRILPFRFIKKVKS